MSNPNLDILELVAQALGPVCDEGSGVAACRKVQVSSSASAINLVRGS